jgi:hypothetical protein
MEWKLSLYKLSNRSVNHCPTRYQSPKLASVFDIVFLRSKGVNWLNWADDPEGGGSGMFLKWPISSKNGFGITSDGLRSNHEITPVNRSLLSQVIDDTPSDFNHLNLNDWENRDWIFNSIQSRSMHWIPDIDWMPPTAYQICEWSLHLKLAGCNQGDLNENI